MKRNFKYRLLMLLFLGLFIISCEYETIEPIEADPITETVYFSSDIILIFENYCAGCHNSGHSLNLSAEAAYDNINNDTYIDKNTPENSLLYTVLKEGHYDMASSSDYNVILAWIRQGANNN